MKTIIVIFGVAGSGKSTFSLMLAQALDGPVARLAFADPLKEAAKHLLGIPLHVSNATAAVKESTFHYGKSVRHWLQWLGTEVGREQIHRDVWVQRLADEVIAGPEKFYVVSDGRFENEANLSAYFDGGYRVVNVLIKRDVPVLDHPSETWVAKGDERLFDYVVPNNGSLADLERAAQRIARVTSE